MLFEMSLTLLQNSTLRYVMAPLIGAVIGYFTNLIAVKMLFRPRHTWRIGHWRVPFTPGVIPRRKKALAKTIGQAVSTTLVTQDDLQQVLLSDAAKNAVTQGIVSSFLDRDMTVRAQLAGALGEEKNEALFAALSEKIAAALSDSIGHLDLCALLAERGAELAEKHLGPMLMMFLGKDKIASIAGNFAEQITAYMQENGVAFLQPHVARELDQFADRDAATLLDFCGMTREGLTELVARAYDVLVREKAHVLLNEIHLERIVERKILRMDNRELERLTLYVMKKELDTVVNLGAILGAVIGLLNVFFY